MKNHRPAPQPIHQPCNWLELASMERQKMAYFAAAKERAGEYAATITSQSASDQVRRQHLIALHDERLVLQNIARTTYLGALGAHVEQRGGSFAPDQVSRRSAEAALAGHVIGQFITAAQLLTSIDSLRRTGLAMTAKPLEQQAARTLNRGYTALRLQQALHQQDVQHRLHDTVYAPPLPTTIMNVVIQEVPALVMPYRVAIMRQLLPLTPGRN